MKAYRISGYHKITLEYMVAQVLAIDLQEAFDLMAITHKRLSCLDKRGIEI